MFFDNCSLHTFKWTISRNFISLDVITVESGIILGSKYKKKSVGNAIKPLFLKTPLNSLKNVQLGKR
ncbi:MAG: hypothetical protein BAJALOKI3v1_810009 [Promethearchaeota archaeon]|nr:MAG: hypothetical protein BAJALOKI3v1_810009 [Candidatus Lokiarchaeota archaeon]